MFDYTPIEYEDCIKPKLKIGILICYVVILIICYVTAQNPWLGVFATAVALLIGAITLIVMAPLGENERIRAGIPKTHQTCHSFFPWAI